MHVCTPPLRLASRLAKVVLALETRHLVDRVVELARVLVAGIHRHGDGSGNVAIADPVDGLDAVIGELILERAQFRVERVIGQARRHRNHRAGLDRALGPEIGALQRRRAAVDGGQDLVADDVDAALAARFKKTRRQPGFSET